MNAITKLRKAPFSICNSPILSTEQTAYMNAIFAWASHLQVFCLVYKIYGFDIDKEGQPQAGDPESAPDARYFGECRNISVIISFPSHIHCFYRLERVLQGF